MKYNKIILSMVALLIGMYSCTDTWDDHYDANSGAANGTLWEAISSNADLSNFTKVLKATGYSDILNTSQVFTVFAPTNKDFTEAQADELIAEYNLEKSSGVKDKKNSVLQEFIGNHIALYNYSLAESAQDTMISMLNTKNIKLTRTTFGNKEILSRNDLRSNGVLFTIDGMAPYNYNIYEYIKADKDLDSLRNYVYAFHLDKFVASESVPGEIVDGKTQYVDSVTEVQNELLGRTWMKASLNDEDSTYWFVAPTNSVWKSQLEDNITFFQYDKQVTSRDSLMYMFPRANIIMGTTFSKTLNKTIFENKTATAKDSAMSTLASTYSYRQTHYPDPDNKKYYQYDDPYGASGVFNGTENVECSNGVVMKATTWNIPRHRTFVRDIVVEGESTDYIDSLNVKSSDNKSGDTSDPANNRKSVSIDNPFYDQVSWNKYLEITPSGLTNFTKAVFKIPNVLSNVPYDVYIVTVPGEAAVDDPYNMTASDSLACLPVAFKACLQCNNGDGYAYYMLKKGDDGTCDVNTYAVYKDKNKAKTPSNTNNINSKVYVNMTSTPGKVDSVYMGRYIFPTCSYNTSEPQVKLLMASTATSSQLNKTYNRTLRLDCIVFKPVESIK